jgi:hypothetical protein
MERLMKALPWLLSAVLAALLAINWQWSRTALEQKEAEVQRLQAQFRLASQREVQVRVSFRKAFFASGNVAGFTNLSDQTIAITADVERPASSQRLRFAMTLDPGQAKEVGEREGWAFIPDDLIKVSQSEHKSLIFVAP